MLLLVMLVLLVVFIFCVVRCCRPPNNTQGANRLIKRGALEKATSVGEACSLPSAFEFVLRDICTPPACTHTHTRARAHTHTHRTHTHTHTHTGRTHTRTRERTERRPRYKVAVVYNTRGRRLSFGARVWVCGCVCIGTRY